jgi:TetR/AcrR family transcriptional regulator
MVKIESSTQERILEAAKEVFHRRGFEGTRMQEIADTAAINKSLLHYYYRNKENLFMAVFTDAFTRMVTTASEIFRSEDSFELKLERFFDYHISFLRQNSYIPWFILNGLYEKPDEIRKLMGRSNFVPPDLLKTVARGLQAEGYTVDDPLQLFLNILSLSVFPIVAKPILSTVFHLSEREMDAFYEKRKRTLSQFVIHALNKTTSQNRAGT